MIDAPGGGGKVPLLPEYVEEINEDEVIFRNYEGKRFVYKQPKQSGGCGSEPMQVPDIVPIAVGQSAASKSKERPSKNGKVRAAPALGHWLRTRPDERRKPKGQVN